MQMQTTYEFNKGVYSRSRSFHDDLILQDQASGERSQDQWSSGVIYPCPSAIHKDLYESIQVYNRSQVSVTGPLVLWFP